MAKIVASLPAARFDPRKPKYDKYFDGQAWKLELGVDCPAEMNIAQNAIRVTAKRKGIDCKIRQSKKENCIYVQAEVVKPVKTRKASGKDRKAG